MTDTANRNQNNNDQTSGMRSSHPQYREYTRSEPRGQAHTQGRRPGQPHPTGQSRNIQNNVRTPQTVRQGTANPRNMPQNVRGYDSQRAAREKEKRRRALERRQEEARRLAEETQKRAAAAAKAAAKKAKRAQAKLLKDLRKLNTVEVKARYSFPAAIIMTALAFTVLIFAIVTTSVRISEITTENSSLQRTYDSLVSEENKLRMQLEIRDDLRTVEELAKNEYGMVKQDQVERYYLRTYNADKIEIIEEKAEESSSGILDRIAGVFSAIGGRILSFFGG